METDDLKKWLFCTIKKLENKDKWKSWPTFDNILLSSKKLCNSKTLKSLLEECEDLGLIVSEPRKYVFLEFKVWKLTDLGESFLID